MTPKEDGRLTLRVALTSLFVCKFQSYDGLYWPVQELGVARGGRGGERHFGTGGDQIEDIHGGRRARSGRWG